MERACDGEIFDVFDETHRRVGQARRLEVHRSGLLHQAVHIVVTRDEGRQVLLQQRAASKRIAPNAWDLSCAEHLQPGETFREGAVRGLREELALEVDADDLILVRPMQLFRRKYDDYEDNEWIELFRYQLRDGQMIRPHPDEVAQIKWVSRTWLLDDLLANPDQYATWFRDERRHL